MPVPVRITFERSSNAAYIYLSESDSGGGGKHVHVHDAPGTVVLDFDAEERLIGIEILTATRRLPQGLLDRAERI